MAKEEAWDEEKWKAEQDARTLADAHAIMKDKKRMEAAQKAAKDIHKDMRDRANEASDSADAMEALASKMYPTMAGGGSQASSGSIGGPGQKTSGAGFDGQ